MFASIEADPRFFEEPGELDLFYNISEGQQYRVGEIRVHISGANPPHPTQRGDEPPVVRPRATSSTAGRISSSERRLKFSQLFRNEPQRRAPLPQIVVRPPSTTRPGPRGDPRLRRTAALGRQIPATAGKAPDDAVGWSGGPRDPRGGSTSTSTAPDRRLPRRRDQLPVFQQRCRLYHGPPPHPPWHSSVDNANCATYNPAVAAAAVDVRMPSAVAAAVRGNRPAGVARGHRRDARRRSFPTPASSAHKAETRRICGADYRSPQTGTAPAWNAPRQEPARRRPRSRLRPAETQPAV